MAALDTLWLVGHISLTNLAQDFNRFYAEDDRVNPKDIPSRSRHLISRYDVKILVSPLDSGNILARLYNAVAAGLNRFLRLLRIIA